MKQRIIITLAVGALALLVSAAALAGTSLVTTGSVTGTAGVSVNVPATATFSDIIDGTDQTVTYSPQMNVVDARGTGVGWNITTAATTFSDGSGHTLAAGTVTGATAACHAGSTCTNASGSVVTYPVTLSASAVKMFSAAAASGLGKVDVTPTFSVSIPGNSYAGTYTSTLTVAAVSGP